MLSRLSPISLLFLLVFASANLHAQGPASFAPSGIGGGGALYNLSIDPHNTQSVFMTSDMSELYHSSDFGKHWSMIDFRQILGGNTTGVVQFSSTTGRLFSITMESETPRGMLSDDGGAHWSSLPNDPVNGAAASLFSDPASPTRLVIADGSSAYFTADGTSFTKFFTASGGQVLRLAGAYFAGQNIFVGSTYGLHVSTNGGQSFTLVTSGIPAAEKIVSMSGATQGGTTRLFAVTNSAVESWFTGAEYDSYAGVYSFDVSQGAWKSIKAGVNTKPVFVGCADGDVNTVYVSGGGSGAPTVFKSTNAGQAWNSVFQTQNNQNIATGWAGDGGDRAWSFGEYALGFTVCSSDPQKLAVCDLGHVYLSNDGGTSWHQGYVESQYENPAGAKTPQGKSYASNGLDETTAWYVEWMQDSVMFAGFADIKGIRSSDGGTTWHHPFDNFSFNATYHYLVTPDKKVYAAASSVHDLYQSTYLQDSRIDGGSGQIVMSSDLGKSWQTLHDFKHPVIWQTLDSKDPHTMYASVVHSTQGGIFVTHNLEAGSASTWTKLTNPPRTEGHPFVIRSLNDGSLVVSYSGRRNSAGKFTQSSGVYFSSDAGQTWLDRSDNGLKYWTKDVVIDPHDQTQNTWYAGSFSGWGGGANDLGALYKTTNRGTSWTKLTGREDVESVTIHPDSADVMYYMTQDHGLWYSSSRRAAQPTFSNVPSYPFKHPVRGFFDPSHKSLWITAFGGGMQHSSDVTKPQAVKLIAPTNGATVQLPVRMKWSAVSNATAYSIQVSTDAQSTMHVLDTTLTDTIAVLTVLPGGQYFWRVSSIESGSNSPWSETWAFTIPSAILPATPHLVSPTNGADISANISSNGMTALLTWEPVQGDGITYDFQLADNSSFTMPLDESTNLVGTDVFVNNLSAGVTYYWQVSAVNATGKSQWAYAWSFKVHALSDVSSASTSAQSLRLAEHRGTIALQFASSTERSHVSVYSSTGVEQISREIDPGVTTLTLRTSDLSKGAYYVELRQGARTDRCKFAVLR